MLMVFAHLHKRLQVLAAVDGVRKAHSQVLTQGASVSPGTLQMLDLALELCASYDQVGCSIMGFRFVGSCHIRHFETVHVCSGRFG